MEEPIQPVKSPLAEDSNRAAYSTTPASTDNRRKFRLPSLTPVRDRFQKQPGAEKRNLPFLQLFRFTTLFERVMMLISCVCAAVHGTLLPMWTIIFGNVITTFSDRNASPDMLVSKISGIAKWFFIIAAIAFVVSYFQVRLQMYVSQRSGARIRNLYIRSLMRQDFEWYDAETSGELTARVASDVDLIQAGIGDKVGSAVQYLSMFVTGFVIAFVFSWKLTLVILSFFPLLAGSGAIIGKRTAGSTSEGQDAYGAAGSVASETLSLIRTVTAFGGQEEEAHQYEKQLNVAYKSGVRKALWGGLGIGVVNFIIFAAYAYVRSCPSQFLSEFNDS
jgi:ABC-type multidrug transport system fused ATPase/permease subunit